MLRVRLDLWFFSMTINNILCVHTYCLLVNKMWFSENRMVNWRTQEDSVRPSSPQTEGRTTAAVNSCILCACVHVTESVCRNIYHSLLLSIGVQCICSHRGGHGRGWQPRAAWTPFSRNWTWSLNVLSLVTIDRYRPATWTCYHLGKSYLRGN